MTETRKQIIELIRDYMDKSLSDKCVVIAIGIDNKLHQYGEIKEFFNGHKRIIYETCVVHINIENILDIKENIVSFTDEIGLERKKFKIIGHYDITAVLKYIQIKVPHFVSMSDLQFMKNGNIRVQQLGEFPIKPLHLYTEQEELQLLYLLLKFK